VKRPCPNQLSRKMLSILTGRCAELASSLARCWRIRSPRRGTVGQTSSSVWSLFMPMPKRMRKRAPREDVVTEASTRVVVRDRLGLNPASIGRIASWPRMKIAEVESSSSPIGVTADQRLLGDLEPPTLRTFSSGMPAYRRAIGRGLAAISLSIWAT